MPAEWRYEYCPRCILNLVDYPPLTSEYTTNGTGRTRWRRGRRRLHKDTPAEGKGEVLCIRAQTVEDSNIDFARFPKTSVM